MIYTVSGTIKFNGIGYPHYVISAPVRAKNEKEAGTVVLKREVKVVGAVGGKWVTGPVVKQMY